MTITTRVSHPEWRDSNDGNNYPFADHATLTNSDGTFIPDTTFLDAVFYPVGAGPTLYLAKAEIQQNTAVLTIGDEFSENVCTGEFDILTPPSSIQFVDGWGRPAGLVVSEPTRLAVFQAWSAGVHQFTEEETPFAATACVPTPELGVRGIVLEDGSIFTGDIWLIGGDGVVLSATEVEAVGIGRVESYTAIRVDVVGDPLFRRRLCDDAQSPPKFIQQLVFMTDNQRVEAQPDDMGNITISAGNALASDSVLRVRPDSAGLTIEVVGTDTAGD